MLFAYPLARGALVAGVHFEGLYTCVSVHVCERPSACSSCFCSGGWSSTNRRSGQERPLISSFRQRGATIAGAVAAGGRNLQHPSPLWPQSPQPFFRRAITPSALGPFGPAAAAGGTATGGAESTETFSLSQLLRTSPHDMLGEASTPAVALGPPSHTCSVRSGCGLEQHVSGFAPASIITVSGVDATAMARQQLDLLVSSIHTTLNAEPTAWGSR